MASKAHATLRTAQGSGMSSMNPQQQSARPFSSTRPAKKKYKGNSKLPMYNWKRACGRGNAVLTYIKKRDSADEHLMELTEIMENLPLEERALGFDMEWRPVFQAGKKAKVALIQLAWENCVWLVHISKTGGPPEKLKEILEDPTIVKTGVGIQFDCKKLWTDWGVNVRNAVDLSLLAKSADNKRWKGPYSEGISLLRLAEAYENCTLDKGKITTSNWEATLDDKMQLYAANDSHVGYRIYTKLLAELEFVDPIPAIECYSFSTVSGAHVTLRSDKDRWKPFNPYYNAGPPPPPPVDPDAPAALKLNEDGEAVPFGLRGASLVVDDVDITVDISKLVEPVAPIDPVVGETSHLLASNATPAPEVNDTRQEVHALADGSDAESQSALTSYAREAADVAAGVPSSREECESHTEDDAVKAAGLAA
ncbi:hypothetical protein CERSUDRAFT_110166 [Gelatoporia subvermispora B]|uniref:3'-5' exonuclease n=1 Tax=Ceriporiopsis subvermispora (strain B) TaxID=914234 RepID=M2PXI1_CERS8|nr:hypothetical protein CERSUDRAFT_110166 [Gelatoporia subvermispora B]